jgi:hypothetical protein
MNEKRKASETRRKDILNRDITAYHEAGHAVVMVHLGFPVTSATVIPGKGFDGRVVGGIHHNKVRPYRLRRYELIAKTDQEMKDEIRSKVDEFVVTLFAGLVSQRSFSLCRAFAGDDAYAAIDDRNAKKTAMSQIDFGNGLVVPGISEDEWPEYSRRLRARTEKIVSIPYVSMAIEHVARELLFKKTLTGKEVRSIYREEKTHHSFMRQLRSR